MTTAVVRADAHCIPLADNSVDLIVTSPPYFALRSYRDEGKHYDGQVGSEPTPLQFLRSLWDVTGECMRVLKPSGSMFVNLGDKYAGSGGHNNSNIGAKAERGPTSYNKSVSVRADGAGLYRERQRVLPDSFGGIRDKSLMGLPWRYAIGCIDGECGEPLILRAEIIWEKPNGMPESVTDRVRRNHEQWFHLVKSDRYFTGIDEIREPHAREWGGSPNGGHTYETMRAPGAKDANLVDALPNPGGRLPGSVWEIATEPLVISEAVREHYRLPDHFAAFPTEWPRRLILGWSPTGICTECGQGRRPLVDKTYEVSHVQGQRRGRIDGDEPDGNDRGINATEGRVVSSTVATIVGHVCACTPRTSHRGTRGDWKEGRDVQPETGSQDFHTAGAAAPRRLSTNGHAVTIPPPPDLPMWEYHLRDWTPAPTRPAVVLDPFGGTGTTAGVAEALGRVGISLDLSFDYCRLAHWRANRSGHFHKVMTRTWGERQAVLF